jgi:hypothetical protein
MPTSRALRIPGHAKPDDLLALLPPQQSHLSCHRARGFPPWPIEAFREWRKLEDIAHCDDCGECEICKRRDELHSTVVRELGLRPWEYGWNRDPYVVGLLTRAAAEA